MRAGEFPSIWPGFCDSVLKSRVAKGNRDPFLIRDLVQMNDLVTAINQSSRMFQDFVHRCIGDNGELVNPLNISVHDRKGPRSLQIAFSVLAVEMWKAVIETVNEIDSGHCKFMMAGFDMKAAPGQGILFDDFVLIAEWNADRDDGRPFRDQFRFGVLNYDMKTFVPGDPSQMVILPIDWGNTYWKQHGFGLIKHFVPFRIRVKPKRPLEPYPGEETEGEHGV